MEALGGDAGNADARRFNGENLVDPFSGKQPRPLLTHLAQQINVHLVVEKTAHLQNISGIDLAILHNPFF